MAANPIGIVITLIGLLITGFTIAYNKSEKFRAGIDGLGAVAKEVFTIIKEAVGNFVEGWDQLKDGNFKEAFKQFGQGLKKTNPIGIAFGEGKRLKEAFNSGYDESLEKSAVDKQAEKFQEDIENLGTTGSAAAEDSAKKIVEGFRSQFAKIHLLTVPELQKLQQDINDALEKVDKESPEFTILINKLGTVSNRLDSFVLNSIDKISKRKSELSKELNAAVIGSEDYNRLEAEIEGLDQQLKALNKSAKGVTSFKKLSEDQSTLVAQIKEAIATGKDYSGLLDQYQKVTEQSTSVTSEFNAAILSINIASGYAETSVKHLSAEVAKLKTQLSQAGGTEIVEITKQLAEAEVKLQEVKDEIERSTIRATDETRTGVLEKDIQKEIVAAETRREIRIQEILLQEQDEQIKSESIKLINAQTDIAIFEERKKLYEQNSAEFIKLENDVSRKREEVAKSTATIGYEEVRKTIINTKLLRIKALSELGLSEKDYAERRKEIEQDTDKQILEARLDSQKLSNEERLALENELAAKEIAINKEKNEALKAIDAERWNKIKAGFEFVANSFTQVSGAVSNFQEAKDNEALARIEEKYNNEIILAEGNTELITELEGKRDSEKEKIEKEAFERAKRLQIAEALISAARGVINILSASSVIPDPFGAIFKGIQIGLLALTTAAQIAKIKSTKFAGGGYTGKGQAKKDETGHRPVGIVHENEYVVPAYVLRSKKGKELVDSLEVMRTNKAAKKGYSASDNNITPMYAAGGFVQPVVTTGETSISLDKDQFNSLVAAVKIAVKEGAVEGNAQYYDTANREYERKQVLNIQTGEQ